MSIEKLLVLTITSSCLLFVSVENQAMCPGQLPQETGNNFTLNQFLGIWYEIAVMYPKNMTPHLKCDWIHIVWDRINAQGFFEVYTKYDDENGVIKIEGYGNVSNSELRVTFVDFRNHVQAFTVTGYNNGQELILIDKKNKMLSGLISRDATKVTLQSRAEFERLADEADGHAVYFDHSNCPPHY